MVSAVERHSLGCRVFGFHEFGGDDAEKIIDDKGNVGRQSELEFRVY